MIAARWALGFWLPRLPALPCPWGRLRRSRIARGSISSRRRFARSWCSSCYECHSAKAKSVKGGLLLDTREGIRQGGESGAAVVPGNTGREPADRGHQARGAGDAPQGEAARGRDRRLREVGPDGRPDPRDGKAVAVKKEIDIEEGRKFWAFQPPKAAEPPQGEGRRLAQDRYRSLHPGGAGSQGPDARRRRRLAHLLRRVTFDLTGLPPTPEEIEALRTIGSPQSAIRTRSVVDRLLASPQFGERWGRHWLDVARYAESTGKERNIPYPLCLALSRLRHRRLQRRQAVRPLHPRADRRRPAAGRERRSSANAQLIATGFLALGPKGLNERASAAVHHGHGRRADRRHEPGRAGH